ncbi:MAG: RHS repeat-associated core domain-containing protein, partial [Gammaproteobacteria bacterium]|nr:RHS repeat-associated core domain-containing protein [Gammaproteobacteria bacterium]
NMTSRTVGGTTYTLMYDAENRMTAVSGGDISATFVYDADGNRVLGTVDGTTTIYIAGVYEYQAGATTHYYEGPTGGAALRRTGHTANNGVFYLLGDHLGSTSVLVNQNGTLNTSNYYYPYGGNRGGAQSTLTAKRYTGQYHEEGLAGSQGLYYYGARWYDPQLARFAQADTIVPDPGSAMAFNRYMYVAGNPIRFNDPSGNCIPELCPGGGRGDVSAPGSWPPSGGSRGTGGGGSNHPVALDPGQFGFIPGVNVDRLPYLFYENPNLFSFTASVEFKGKIPAWAAKFMCIAT